MNLQEAIVHARNIKTLRCKMCGQTMSINGDLVAMVATIRRGSCLCATCQRIADYYDTRGKLPTNEELWD